MTPAAWLGVLGRASLEGGLLVFAVWALASMGPRLPPAARALLWWAASARLLLACVPLAPLNVPLANPIPAFARSVAARISAPAVSPGQQILPLASADTDATDAPAGAPASRLPGFPGLPRAAAVAALAWTVCALWAAGVLLRLSRWARESATVERAWRAAAPIDDATIVAWLVPWLGDAAERVEVREGDDFATPLVLGGARGRILLPRGFASLPPADRRAALAHEAAHLRRHDLSFGVVVALAECAFWFHPLATVAAREYALAREEACDAEALRLSGATPDRYGELLLRIGLEPSPPARAAASCGSRRVEHLRRRILMLAHASSRSRGRRVGGSALVVAACVALLPMRFIAPASAANTADPGRDRTVTLHGKTTIVTQDRGPRVHGALDPEAFSFGRYHDGSWFFWGSFDDGTQAGIKRLESKAGDDELFWFRIHDRGYVIRDPQALDHLREMLAPIEELSSRQGRFGNEQGRLGDRQGAMGEREGALGAQEAKLDAQLDEIEQQLEDLDAHRKPTDEVRRRRDDLRQRRNDLQLRERALDREMEELGRMQDSLGRIQDDLGEQSEKLMDRAARDVLDYVRPLIASGKAQPTR